ncbi:MAG: hypothetical protein KZQ64_06680 [gamma proteobacterium symbiont of Bathyaustriella thionipta]|nr:hypothetical protein [gamma proteobacterium symbiont of Bathyaustriella thionipta]MCU7953058.1 hypothetical protein [gamma proteobacterium symbiont of Bathyaustriella thionipta]MCU7957569.1 hypothetical protein [gamma proteobacterium symbiont of Bathyaustriella thionipta]MCU7965849.1 hypothetical protein [gamma proteobacterium symbiont of Bathyaustriella thionipta]
MESKFIDISLVCMRTHKHPPGMENWRYFRIEYGGSRHETIAEEGLWLPPNLDEEDIENLLINSQK